MFGSITIELTTTKPEETNAEIEDRCEEFDKVQARVELALQSCIPPGWSFKIKEN
jgi:hypothetical protein